MAGDKIYKREEVKEHTTASSCWIIINNQVLDVTKFLDEHPGGCEVLLEHAGNDATEAFEDVGHSTDARQMLPEYILGDVVEEEKWAYTTSKKSTDKDGNTEIVTQGPIETLIYPAMLVIIAAFVYYLLFN
ncbi:Cytochrome b5 [Strongyloides ratti]|uniref:Cytochrome b5 n=1 Tax=Strongyloides ratti TaxID=34506 RepID=A0A090LKZ0_STRRB|nr:Cytochrome b5 [Strongyloides ratti]CEF68838.1 Cytochrome b5 [Strongyloides ratti]